MRSTILRRPIGRMRTHRRKISFEHLEERFVLCAPSLTAAYVQGSANGSNGVTTNGGSGGTIDIRSGVRANVGDGSDGWLRESITLSGGEYDYRQIAAIDDNDRLTITVTGNVTIRSQYVINANIVATGPAEVAVFAGQGVKVNLFASQLDPRQQVYHCGHSVTFNLNGRFDAGENGGKFEFKSTQVGKLAASVNAEGGRGINGGNGGNVTFLTNSNTIDYNDQLVANVSGGFGDNYSKEEPNGGNGGSGGAVSVAAHFFQGGFIAEGASGGHGGPGLAGENGTPGSNGGNGGEGGAGGSITIETDSTNGVFANVSGGRGGRGGPGGQGGPGVDASPGGKGGNGGNGGDGGRAGQVVGIDVPPTSQEPGTGGDAGAGGSGGGGTPPGGKGSDGEPGSDGMAGSIPSMLNVPEHETDKWDVFVYSAADDNRVMQYFVKPNSIEDDLLRELDRIERVNLAASDVNLIVQMDRHPDNSIILSDYFAPSGQAWGEPFGNDWGNWSDSRRGIPVFDQHASLFGHIATALGPIPYAPDFDVNTGASGVLADFYFQGRSELRGAVHGGPFGQPSENTMLVIEGHAAGWRGFAHDDSANKIEWAGGRMLPDRIMMHELRATLESIKQLGQVSNLDLGIDVLVWGACQTQLLEVVTELVGHVDYVVGTQSSDTARVFDSDWLEQLAANSSIDPQELATLVGNSMPDGLYSVIDVQKAADLIPRMAELVDELWSNENLAAAVFNDPSAGTVLVDLAKTHELDFRDFGDFLHWVQQVVPTESRVHSLAGELIVKLSEAILTQRDDSVSGLSIYMPLTADVDIRYDKSIRFNQETGWDDLIKRQRGNLIVESDDAPDAITQALQLGLIPFRTANTSGQIANENDVDFYRLDMQAGDRLFVDVISITQSLQSVVTLYGSDQQTVLAQQSTTASGVAGLSSFEVPSDGDYYIAVTSSGNNDPLNPTQGAGTGEYSLNIIYGGPDELKPTIGLSALEIDFGSVALGSNPAQTLQITNTGKLPLLIGAIGQPEGDPLVIEAPSPALPLPYLLPPGGKLAFDVVVVGEALGMFETSLQIISDDPSQQQLAVSITVEITEPIQGVVGQHAFYEKSGFAENDSIARDKVALESGEASTVANYTNYVRGLNGIQVDLADANSVTALTPTDFTFRPGRTNNTTTWTTVPIDPTITLRPGEGVSGSDRITLTWPGGTITNTWLEVTVKANENTGLAEDDIFYFGNQIGDTNGDGLTNATDFQAIRANPANFLNPADVDNAFDINKDGLVNATDLLIVRDHFTPIGSGLPMITPSGPAVGKMANGDEAGLPNDLVAAALAWEQRSSSRDRKSSMVGRSELMSKAELSIASHELIDSIFAKTLIASQASQPMPSSAY